MNYDDNRAEHKRLRARPQDDYQKWHSPLVERLGRRSLFGIILPFVFLLLYFTVDTMGVLSASTMSAIAVLAIIFMVNTN
jgi:hypothetical protein